MHFDDILADDALFLQAQILEQHLDRAEEARERYERLLFDHPGSLYVIEARERYRALSTDPS